jgi:hypothetical protein
LIIQVSLPPTLFGGEPESLIQIKTISTSDLRNQKSFFDSSFPFLMGGFRSTEFRQVEVPPCLMMQMFCKQ